MQEQFDEEEDSNTFLFPFVKDKMKQESKQKKIQPVHVQDIFDYRKINQILSFEKYLLETVVQTAISKRYTC
jgi:hypothetical protein